MIKGEINFGGDDTIEGGKPHCSCAALNEITVRCVEGQYFCLKCGSTQN